MKTKTICEFNMEYKSEDLIDVDPEIIKKMKIRLSKDFKDFLSIARKLGRENEFLNVYPFGYKIFDFKLFVPETVRI